MTYKKTIEEKPNPRNLGFFNKLQLSWIICIFPTFSDRGIVHLALIIRPIVENTCSLGWMSLELQERCGQDYVNGEMYRLIKYIITVGVQF